MDINKLCPACMKFNEGEEICPNCGAKMATENGSEELPVRYILAKRYAIGKVTAKSCEAITYLGLDGKTGDIVNIKEYYPEGIAVRNGDGTVSPEEEKGYAYNDGLITFLELNKKLLDTDLPALAETYDVFEANGTVYAVKEVLEDGITLKKYIESNDGSLPWEQARPMFLPLIDTLSELNRLDIIHGGISPETLFVGEGGRLYIHDIMINRTRRADEDLIAQIYGGYAAIEQYEADGIPLGTYTDVYGIAATLFRTLIGTVPPEACDRIEKDTLAIPSHFAEELPRQVLVAMANGMQVLASNRTQTVEKFNDELVYGETVENMAAAEKRKKTVDKKPSKAVKIYDEPDFDGDGEEEKSGVKTWLVTAICTVAALAVLGIILYFTGMFDSVFKKEEIPVNNQTTSSTETSSSEVQSQPEIDEVNYEVPNFTGSYLKDIEDNEKFIHFTFKVLGRKNCDLPKGQICEQSLAPGSTVHSKSEVGVVISLGPDTFSLNSVVGMSELEAKVLLLKQGILYDNIEIVDKYDSSKEPNTIIEQSPESGEAVTADSVVRIYINSYKGD